MEVTKETRVELSLGAGRKAQKVFLVLRGSQRAIEELMGQLATCGQPAVLEVTGGTCCWTFAKGDTTLHLVVDGQRQVG